MPAPTVAGRWQVSLPMYDFDALRDATDAWWAAIAVRLGRGPTALLRSVSVDRLWRSGELLLSQTCGYPMTHAFKGVLQVVATPVYRAPGCCGASYSSALVTRRRSELFDIESLRGAALAVNGQDSLSGYHVWQRVLGDDEVVDGFFSDVAVSGSHRGSIEDIAEGRADVAAVDAVTFALLADTEPELMARVRVMRFTHDAPALPYVTRASASPEQVDALRQALFGAAADPSLNSVRQRLRIDGFEVLPDDAYDEIAALP